MVLPKIKICGLTHIDDISFVNEARCDYVGFVFAESKRRVTFSQAKELKAALSLDIKSVGVFVDSELSFIEELCLSGIIDIVQLHGEEDNEFINHVKTHVGVPVIKSFSVRSKGDIYQAEKSSADMVLFDTFSSTKKGGTGNVFNWDLIKDTARPFILAGGLNCDNIKIAFDRVKPFCFDISSGVETNGVKDRNKINEIVKLVRSLK